MALLKLVIGPWSYGTGQDFEGGGLSSAATRQKDDRGAEHWKWVHREAPCRPLNFPAAAIRAGVTRDGALETWPTSGGAVDPERFGVTPVTKTARHDPT